MKIDRHFLFQTVRPTLFSGKLSQMQVDGIDAVIDAFEDHAPKASTKIPTKSLLDWCGYVLATPYHETDRTFNSHIREYGLGKGKKYGVPGRHKQAPYGRGYVQLTWDDNYEWADKALGLDGALLANFDLALEPKIAASILVVGMIDGAFTGANLARYFDFDSCDPENARRIINGKDKASTIAGYWKKFRAGLKEFA